VKIPVIKPDVLHLEALRQQLVNLQDNINKALGFLGFGYSQRLDVTCRTAELPILLTHKLPMPAWGLELVYLRNLTDDTNYPTDGAFVNWIPESGGVKIRGITGLTAGDLYEMRFLVYA
jgi:hypothetical protein